MELNKNLNILGRNVSLARRAKDKLQGLNVGEKLSYVFYDGTYLGAAMLFVEPKKENPTPKICQLTSSRLTDLYGLPVVFILQSGPTYERTRLMDKGVFFVMSGQYAYLPMLVATEKSSNRAAAKILSPVAQYLLLFHLQVKSIEGMTAREIAPLVPYSYESVTLGITCLADVGLAEKIKAGQRSKAIHFFERGKELWNKAQAYLTNPVETRFFCDTLDTADAYPTCGINALAHYSRLSPDAEKALALTAKEYRELNSHGVFVGQNQYDGNYIVEVWKYPPLRAKEDNCVDRLSLILSLNDEGDPRVEKEVEYLRDKMEWKD
jgi:hypothetical protein